MPSSIRAARRPVEETAPDVGFVTPAMHFRIVVLPAPLAPNNAYASPGLTSILTSSSAVIVSPPGVPLPKGQAERR